MKPPTSNHEQDIISGPNTFSFMEGNKNSKGMASFIMSSDEKLSTLNPKKPNKPLVESNKGDKSLISRISGSLKDVFDRGEAVRDTTTNIKVP